MPRHYMNYNDDDLKEAIKNSNSIANVLKLLGLKTVGGNYLTIKRKIQKLDLDISHFTGKAWNKGKVLKDIKSYIKPKFKKEALAKIKKSRSCEICKRKFWLNKLIPLEIHHKDKDQTNNSNDNLQLLCKNCHAVIHGKT